MIFSNILKVELLVKFKLCTASNLYIMKPILSEIYAKSKN